MLHATSDRRLPTITNNQTALLQAASGTLNTSELDTTLISNGNIAIYKNGSAYKRGSFLNASATSGEQATIVSSLVYCNGSTDYVEIYGNVNGTTPLFYGSDTLSTYFNGSMVRGA